MGDFLGSLAVAVVAAVVTAVVTVYLALRRFRTERWWERRIDAYTRIIDALHDDRICSEKHMHECERGRTMDDAERENVKARSEAAYAVIQRAIDTGSFLLSNDANALLATMQEETDKARKAEDFYEYIETQHEISKEYLKVLSQIARRDLHV